MDFQGRGEPQEVSEPGSFPLQKEECVGIRRVGNFTNSGGTADFFVNSVLFSEMEGRTFLFILTARKE
jgi:hypothetical protein